MGQIIHVGGGTLPDVPRHEVATNGKRALVLGGGGIAGAAFHTGALLALNDVLSGFRANDFDLFVGTSAGAFLCSFLANGITPEDFSRSQLGRGPSHLPRIGRKQILRPVPGRVPRSAIASVGAIRSTAKQVARSRGHTSLVDAFFSMTEGLASWRLYTTRGIEEYLKKVFAMPGRTDNFADLASRGKELLIPATDVDTAERIIFGLDGIEPRISEAVAASAAIPIIYEPFQIGGRDYLDGGLRSATNLDIALERGASFIVLINPLVPYLHDTRYLLRGFDSAISHVSEGGLGRLVAQVFRIMAHSQLEKEIDLLRVKYPDVDVLVIEPHRNDEHLFIFNLMDYGAREQLARDAFEQVAVDLVTHFPAIDKLFERAGIALSKQELLDQLQMILAGGTPTALADEDENEEEESA